MILYRIAREKYVRDVSGRGGMLSVARWHDHMPIIYTSPQSSTCILEKMVHLVQSEIHHDLQLIEMEVPDNSSKQLLDVDDLPVSWTNYPAPPILQRIGNAWLSSMASLLLFVPSVIDPYTTNVLINPMHPEAKDISIQSVRKFIFDQRLFK
jgi:RES domain-containing protein